MIEVNESLFIRIREIRAKKNITLSKASQEIGISSKTLGLLENEVLTRINKKTYQKITEWIMKG